MDKYKLKEVNDNIEELLGTKYDCLFEPIIKSRGINYSRLNKIKDIIIVNNLVKAKVLDTKEYDVTINFVKEKINEVSCSCPYHEKSTYCKHIYAVLYELSKEDKKEACKRYKEYVLYNAKIVNDFFIDVNNIIRYNKNNLHCEFLDTYSDIFYEFDGKYDDLKLDKKELSQLNDYLNIIKKDYEKIESIYNEVTKLKNINFDIEDINKKEKEKNKIEEQIYKDNISIEKLIEIRKVMPELNFDKNDIEYVEERINNYVEELESIEQIQQIKNKLKEIKLSVSYCDRMIRRLKGIKEQDVVKLDKDDLEYFLYNSDDIYVLLSIKYNMAKYKFGIENCNDINEYINSAIDSIYKIDELKEVKQKMKEYGFDLSYINKAIFKLKFNVYKESNDPLIRNLDAYIENTPLEVLEKVSEDNIKNDRDNRIIEKAIKNKKKKIKEIEKLRKKEAKQNKLINLDTLFSLFTRSSTKQDNNYNYSSIEEEEIRKGNYESYQFEEEDLEEDDYYFEDDLD